MNMHNKKKMKDNEYLMELDAIKSDINLLRRQLFIDDVTKAKNKLWIFKEKLKYNETFSDFGFLISLKISGYGKIAKKYESNVGDKLLKQVSDYMIRYMKENHLNYEIVRYKKGNFLIFMYDLNEEKVEEQIINMQNGMSNYKFKHRSKMFKLTFYSAVMQFIENESFSSVMDQLDEKLFKNKI